jgi:hypothetical protein
MLLPSCLPYALFHCTKPLDQENMPSMSFLALAPASMVQMSLKAFNDAIQEANRCTLKPKQVPDPNGARWWNDVCSMAHTLTCNATRDARWAASLNLKCTIITAKCQWAYDKLHKAVDASNVWKLANHRKGRRTTIFPPLKKTDGMTTNSPKDKVIIFRDKFFLGNPSPVPLQHPTNPPLCNTQKWPPVTTDNISQALKMTANNSTLGPSEIGYKILKWAHAA